MIVGIGGQMAAGKDTLADQIAASLPATTAGGWARSAFAHGVKKVFEATFGVDREWVERWKRIDHPPPGFAKTVRQMLIDIGDGFRGFRGDVWINRALAEPGNLVISDARYLNELAAIKRRNGVTIALWRPDGENDNPNPSERELRAYIQKFIDAGVRGPTGDPLVDLFVVNDGSVADLYAYAGAVVVPWVAARMAPPAAAA
jgi:hypothetical protein